MSSTIANLESIDFRLKSLQALERKTKKAIAFIDSHEMANWRSVDRSYWKYCLSLVRFVARKWKTATSDNYSYVAHLQDVNLRQALSRNVMKVRRSILATENHQRALQEWDHLWKSL